MNCLLPNLLRNCGWAEVFALAVCLSTCGCANNSGSDAAEPSQGGAAAGGSGGDAGGATGAGGSSSGDAGFRYPRCGDPGRAIAYACYGSLDAVWGEGGTSDKGPTSVVGIVSNIRRELPTCFGDQYGHIRRGLPPTKPGVAFTFTLESGQSMQFVIDTPGLTLAHFGERRTLTLSAFDYYAEYAEGRRAIGFSDGRGLIAAILLGGVENATTPESVTLERGEPVCGDDCGWPTHLLRAEHAGQVVEIPVGESRILGDLRIANSWNQYVEGFIPTVGVPGPSCGAEGKAFDHYSGIARVTP